MSRTVLWLAHGLSKELTGIERLIHHLVAEFRALPEFDRVAIRMTVDGDAVWPATLVGDRRISIEQIPRRARSFWTAPNSDEAVLVHSFGAALPPRSAVPSIVTVCDWGPLRFGSAFPLRARLRWAPTMLWNIERASMIHFLAPAVVTTAPSLVARVCSAKSIVATPRAEALSKPFGLMGKNDTRSGCSVLFVGSARPNKRLDVLLEAAKYLEGIEIIAVGEGTEGYAGENFKGLGRVGEDDLERLFAEAGGCVLISSYEGLGFAVDEAARRGLRTVVSSEVASVQPGRLAGHLVVARPVSAEGVAAAIVEMLASRHSAPHYASGETAQGLWDFYRAAIQP